MAKTLHLDKGIIDYDIDGTTISFNPTDVLFGERLAHCMDAMETLQQKYAGKLQVSKDAADAWRTCRAIDQDMRAAIDEALNAPGAADSIFGSVSCYALTDGLPLWVELIFALWAEMDEAVTAQLQRTDSRVQAYLSKYSRTK